MSSDFLLVSDWDSHSKLCHIRPSAHHGHKFACNIMLKTEFTCKWAVGTYFLFQIQGLYSGQQAQYITPLPSPPPDRCLNGDGVTYLQPYNQPTLDMQALSKGESTRQDQASCTEHRRSLWAWAHDYHMCKSCFTCGFFCTTVHPVLQWHYLPHKK